MVRHTWNTKVFLDEKSLAIISSMEFKIVQILKHLKLKNFFCIYSKALYLCYAWSKFHSDWLKKEGGKGLKTGKLENLKEEEGWIVIAWSLKIYV